ncbi:MAG TPA: BTAD domain-containing putative transcriptional regulator [Gaiellaceae bacterium]|nr:BTAD domain-containing putative transcriptional regulator [Gaiellaceae bacterium]
MEFRILGRLEVVDDGRDVTPSRPKERALLALLLIRAGELVSVDEAVDALWGPSPPPAARNAVQGHVSRLRRTLGPERIESRDGYRLRIEDDELDADRFERLVTDARGRPPEARHGLLSEALSLFRGEPLADFRYESFARGESDRIDELRLSALEDRVDAELELRRHGDVVAELERLVQEQPLRERLHAQLMLALYRAGRHADALDAYQRARRSLDELGLQPAPELRRLERRILEHDPTLELPPEPAARLPQPPTPFVGREEELATATALLLRSDVRIVTLVGPGGAGKTRLALELARQNGGRFRDGVAFAALASLTDPTLVVATIARAFELPETAARTPEETLADHLEGRQTLIVLDNLEHLLDSVPALGALVAAAPELKLLATSREPLRLYGEHLYPVPALADEAAVALFLDRAQAVRPDLDRDEARPAAHEICRRLDGLPLAIELAAGQVTSFEPATLVTRLDDRLALLVEGARDQPERQQTLRNTLLWSHDLLSAAEQRLFARLAVFSGGWSVEAAHAVCNGDLDVVAGLTSLEEKSLVEVAAATDEPRLTMLETIREFAAERLHISGDADDRRAEHARYFLATAEAAEPELPSSPGELLDRLELDHANIRAAFDSFMANAEHDHALRLAGAIWRFWYLRGHLSEGRHRLETALAADATPTLGRAKSLNGAAAMAINSGDGTAARGYAEQALDLHRRLGDEVGAAYAAFMLANTLADVERARTLYEQSIDVFARNAADEWTLLATRHLAYLEDELGDRERARALHEDNLARARTAGSARFAASSLSALGRYALEDDRVDEAVELLRESVVLHRELGDVLDAAVDLGLFASALARAGKPEIATTLASALDSLSGDIGVRAEEVRGRNEQTLVSARGALDAARFDDAWQRGRTLTLREAIDLALVPSNP